MTDSVILLIEDKPKDVVAMERAFTAAEVTNPIVHCADGESALAYLLEPHGDGDGKQATIPALILLDLSLPGASGLEVLEGIKAEDGLKQIPVIVVTMTADKKTIEDCYRAGAISYWHKPASQEELVEAVTRLKGWLEITRLGQAGAQRRS